MDDEGHPESIEDVLERVEEAGGDQARVSVAHVVDEIGDGAFAPLMLAPALVVVSPASAILGLSSVCGAIIALVAVQMVIGREKLWLPGFILRLTVSNKALDRAVSYMAGPARFVDRLTRRRLSVLVEPPLTRLWAAVCLLLAVVMPLFELVPMSATILASAISLLALAIVARDGLLVILGLAVPAAAGWLVWTLLS